MPWKLHFRYRQCLNRGCEQSNTSMGKRYIQGHINTGNMSASFNPPSFAHLSVSFSLKLFLLNFSRWCSKSLKMRSPCSLKHFFALSHIHTVYFCYFLLSKQCSVKTDLRYLIINAMGVNYLGHQEACMLTVKWSSLTYY